MVDVVLVLVGLAVLAAVAADALATTLTVGGAGPLTRLLVSGTWRVLLRLHRPGRGSRLLTGAGAGLLLATVLLWVAGLWAGWSLVLLGTGAVVDSQTSAPAGVLDVVYYAGFTVFTLGVGDFVAASPGTRVLTALASFSGLFLITLAITYLLSAVSAAVARRALAVRISALGDTAEEVVVRGWTGQDFSSAFVQHLVALSEQLGSSAEQHLAYPVLHEFRSRDRRAAAPLAISVLDDALLLLEAGVEPAARPDVSATDPVRRAVGRYLDTASTAGSGDLQAPAAPDLAALREAGLPVVDADAFARRVTEEAGRRRRLHRLVVSGGWSWPGGAR